MSNITLILLCAGESTRFELPTKKQWLRIGQTPLWLYVLEQFNREGLFDEIIITAHESEVRYMKQFCDNVAWAQGGKTRQESIQNSLRGVSTPYVMISDIARVDIPKDILHTLVQNRDKADCVVPYLTVSDTVLYDQTCIDRNKIKLIQTPQLSRTEVLRQALDTNTVFTDESSAIQSNEGSVYYIEGSDRSRKLTFSSDIETILQSFEGPSEKSFMGIGFDLHPFEENRSMVLGGVAIDVPYGFKAHSDGDVMIHSIIDALLGAVCGGDIGDFFPDTDEKYHNISSLTLLEEIVAFIQTVGYEIDHIDCTIIAQKPKITPYKSRIQEKLSSYLHLKRDAINIKATTTERLGFIGREEALAVQSIATVSFYDWKNRKENGKGS